MTILRVLILVIVVTITLNSSCNNTLEKKDSVETNCDSIVSFYSLDKSVNLQKNEYSFNKNQIGYDLHILNDKKLQLIRKLRNPSIEFCINSNKTIAKSNHILSSTVPKNANYFFPINDNGLVFLVRNNTVLIRKIK